MPTHMHARVDKLMHTPQEDERWRVRDVFNLQLHDLLPVP